jgi:hypothetical protein
MTSALNLLAMGAPAVVCPDGDRLSYSDLRALIADCRACLDRPAKALVVVDAPRSLGGLLGYLAGLRAGHAVMFVEARDGGPPWPDLLAAYRPELLVAEPGGPVARPAGRAGFRLRHARPIPVRDRSDRSAATPVHPDLGLLARTSGSLGPPKTVRLSFDNLRSNASAISRALALRPGDRPAVRRVLAARAEARAGGDD